MRTPSSVIEQLTRFLEENKDGFLAREWLSDDAMQVYVRKGRRSLKPDVMSTTLDIANVTVAEGKQNQGLWTEFLEKAHEINPWEVTYVECVHNPYLVAQLGRMGWYIYPPNQYAESFYMPKDPGFFQEHHRKFQDRQSEIRFDLEF